MKEKNLNCPFCNKNKANLQVLCTWCNKIKTKSDIGNIAQSKRFEKVVGKGRDLLWYS
jgi:hypothetical protein